MRQNDHGVIALSSREIILTIIVRISSTRRFFSIVSFRRGAMTLSTSGSTSRPHLNKSGHLRTRTNAVSTQSVKKLTRQIRVHNPHTSSPVGQPTMSSKKNQTPHNQANCENKLHTDKRNLDV